MYFWWFEVIWVDYPYRATERKRNEFVWKIEVQEIEVWEIEIWDIEIREIDIWDINIREIEVEEIEFGILICNQLNQWVQKGLYSTFWRYWVRNGIIFFEGIRITLKYKVKGTQSTAWLGFIEAWMLMVNRLHPLIKPLYSIWQNCDDNSK